jgi:hypothetical protein
VGIKLCKLGYQTLGKSIYKSTRLRRFLLQNCNVEQYDYLKQLSDCIYDKILGAPVGLKDVRSLEMIDL